MNMFEPLFFMQLASQLILFGDINSVVAKFPSTRKIELCVKFSPSAISFPFSIYILDKIISFDPNLRFVAIGLLT